MKPERFLLAALLIFLFPLFLHGETATVITKENAIREYCKFFAPVKARVKYDDTLEILSPQGDWFKVRFRATAGCIHKSAIEKKTASTLGSFLPRKSSGVSQSEASLAGKGFNPQVESSFRQKHPEMNYGLVDRVERFDASIPDKSLSRFISGGGLRQP